MNICAYIRVSGQGQVEGHGLERQLDAIKDYAVSQELQFDGVFSDVITGKTTSESRPAFYEMLEGRPDIILVENATRLARDLIASEMILAECRGLGIQVIDCSSGINLSEEDPSPTAVLIRQILGAVAQHERDMIEGRMSAARARKRAENGRCEGPKPFGELSGEMEILETLRRWRKQGWSYRGIASAANHNGLRTRHGGPWRPSTVHSVLGREKVT